jgi:hypothetical protein
MQADGTRNGTPMAHSHAQRQQHHEIKEHARLLGKLIGFGMTSATGFLTPGSGFFPPYPPLPVERWPQQRECVRRTPKHAILIRRSCARAADAKMPRR